MQKLKLKLKQAKMRLNHENIFKRIRGGSLLAYRIPKAKIG